MRSDSAGFFWEDLPPAKREKKEKIKRQPPEPVWLYPDYLPHFDLASTWQPDLLNDREILDLQRSRDPFIYDIECYPNYFLLGMRSKATSKMIIFERYFDKYLEENSIDFNIDKLKWCMENLRTVGFNSISYDNVIATLAANGKTNQQLWEATEQIIKYRLRPHEVLRNFKCKKLKIDNLDLIELTALGPSLKTVSARIGAELIMDLPFEPGTHLSRDQATITRWYNNNDLKNTELVFDYHSERIKLREDFGQQYAIDLRSKSNAQMAEAIFSKMCRDLFKGRITYPQIRPGHHFYYKPPHYIQFQTPYFNWVLETVCSSRFEIDESGIVSMPPQIKNLLIEVNGKTYNFGKGGLHSQEEACYHIAKDGYELIDIDVTSFYPYLMLSFDIVPEAIGPIFKKLYRGILDKRIEAKILKILVTAEGLKIVVNGSFGKTLEPHSILYQPELGIQTTITGQLLLLMLIEQYELNSIPVLSANTDGIVLKVHESRKQTYKNILNRWEELTNLKMEETKYSAIFNANVNNYLAFKPDGKIKRKGFLNEVSSDLAPPNQVCIDAVINFLKDGKSIEETVINENRLDKFISLRGTKNGGVKDGEYLGKIIRWYYSTEITGEIVSAKSGNKIPRSDNARPIQMLPKTLPPDIDRNWYIEEGYKILNWFGIEINRPQGEVVE